LLFICVGLYINLVGGGISDKGTEVLSKAIEVNKNLRVFYIRGDYISDIGAKSIGKAMTAKRNLEAIYLCTS
jgi:hypothetical protein